MCHPSWTRALTAAQRPSDLASAGHGPRFTELAGGPPGACRREAPGVTEGMPSCAAKQVTMPARDRAAPATEPQLA
jgi:hypothetical protein